MARKITTTDLKNRRPEAVHGTAMAAAKLPFLSWIKLRRKVPGDGDTLTLLVAWRRYRRGSTRHTAAEARYERFMARLLRATTLVTAMLKGQQDVLLARLRAALTTEGTEERLAVWGGYVGTVPAATPADKLREALTAQGKLVPPGRLTASPCGKSGWLKVIVTPDWLLWGDRTVPRLAMEAWGDGKRRRPGLLPILADAMLDAGCPAERDMEAVRRADSFSWHQVQRILDAGAAVGSSSST
jgi:hypothetical protein